MHHSLGFFISDVTLKGRGISKIRISRGFCSITWLTKKGRGQKFEKNRVMSSMDSFVKAKPMHPSLLQPLSPSHLTQYAVRVLNRITAPFEKICAG